MVERSVVTRSYPDRFFRKAMFGSFTGMGAGSAQWVVSPNPLELTNAPTRTVPTPVPAAARMRPAVWRVAPTTPGAAGDRAVAGPPYRLAAPGGSVAARDPHGPGRLDRTPFATDARRCHVREQRVRAPGADQSGRVAGWTLPAAPGRYPTNDALHSEHPGVGVCRARSAAGLAALVWSAARRLLEADRPTTRRGRTPAATAGAASGRGRSGRRLTDAHPSGAAAWLGLPDAGDQRHDPAAAGAGAARGGASGRVARPAARRRGAADGPGVSQAPGQRARRGYLAAWPSRTLAAGEQSRPRPCPGQHVRTADAGRGALP